MSHIIGAQDRALIVARMRCTVITLLAFDDDADDDERAHAKDQQINRWDWRAILWVWKKGELGKHVGHERDEQKRNSIWRQELEQAKVAPVQAFSLVKSVRPQTPTDASSRANSTSVRLAGLFNDEG